jgi:hypothetical protein
VHQIVREDGAEFIVMELVPCACVNGCHTIQAVKQTFLAVTAALLSATPQAAPASIKHVQRNVERLEGRTISVTGCVLAKDKSMRTPPRTYQLKDRSGEEITVITSAEMPIAGECLNIRGVVGKLGGFRCGHGGGFVAFLRESERQPLR